MIIDLAIEGDDEPTALGKHRLPACIREVDDREPAMSKRDTGVGVTPGTISIRPAMPQTSRHAADRREIGGSSSAPCLEYTGDSAHDSPTRACVRRRSSCRAEHQAESEREPHDWMTQDKMGHAENGDRSYHCCQGVE